MSEHRYLHSVEKDEVEFSRLSLQASLVDPATIRHLEFIGVSRPIALKPCRAHWEWLLQTST